MTRHLLGLALGVLLGLPAQAQVTGPTTGGPARSDSWGFSYQLIGVPQTASQFQVQLEMDGTRYGDLYLKRGGLPGLNDFDHASTDPKSGSEVLLIKDDTTPPLDLGIYWVGVWHRKSSTYQLTFSYPSEPSVHPGLGSRVYRSENGIIEGTAFRVWAPFADSVRLAGSFNGFSATQTPMAAEPGGTWSIDVPNLQPGARYQYIVEHDGQLLWRNDPRAREVTNSVGESRVVDPESYVWTDAGYQMPAWNDLVIYEMHLGTFYDEPGGLVGDFDSALSQIDYLAGLGVNALQLLPIAEFAGDSSWGYNPGHPFAVESAYGRVEDLQEFVDAAHDRGMAVFTDVVYNHLGPSDLALWQFDGWNEAGWGGIYFYNDARAVTPWGDTRPDFGRGEVRTYLRDNVMLWLEDYRLDGLRFDSTSNIAFTSQGFNPDGWSWLQFANDELDASQPWKLAIAEDFSSGDGVTNSTASGGMGFDSQWDGRFVHPMRDALIAPNDDDRNMFAVRDAILASYSGDAFRRVIYTESHDEVANGSARVPEEIWPGNADSYYSKKRSTLGAAAVLTAPGIPMLFQGQEFLEDGYFADDDPLDWTKLTEFAGINSLYRDLIALRRNVFGNTGGLLGGNTNVHHLNNGDKVIAYHRYGAGGPGDDVIVLLNFRNLPWSDYRIGLPRSGTWNVRFNSDWSGYDDDFTDHPSSSVSTDAIPYDGMAQSASLSFGPYTCIALSQ